MKWLIVASLLAIPLNAAGEDVEVLRVEGSSFRGYVYRNGATMGFELLGVGESHGTEEFLRKQIGGKTVDVRMRGQYAIVSFGDKLINLEVIKSGKAYYDPNRGQSKLLQEAYETGRREQQRIWPDVEPPVERRTRPAAAEEQVVKNKLSDELASRPMQTRFSPDGRFLATYSKKNGVMVILLAWI